MFAFECFLSAQVRGYACRADVRCMVGCDAVAAYGGGTQRSPAVVLRAHRNAPGHASGDQLLKVPVAGKPVVMVVERCSWSALTHSLASHSILWLRERPTRASDSRRVPAQGPTRWQLPVRRVGNRVAVVSDGSCAGPAGGQREVLLSRNVGEIGSGGQAVVALWVHRTRWVTGGKRDARR